MRTSAGAPSATTRACVEQHHPVGVLRGEREVVHRRDERQAGLRAEAVEQLERLLLVADVEGGGRLVEQDDPRLLRERACDDDALLLAAAERPETPVGEREQVEPRERAGGRVAVARSLLRERAEMRRPAEEHVLGDGHPRRRRRLLRHDGDEPRELRARELVDAGRPSRTISPANGTSRAIARSSVVLPAPFGPMSASHSPSATDTSDAVDDGAAAELDRDAAHVDHAAPPRVVRRTSAKNGAPQNAVTTPSGISAGASAVRAIDVGEDEEARADDHGERDAARGSRRP